MMPRVLKNKIDVQNFLIYLKKNLRTQFQAKRTRIFIKLYNHGAYSITETLLE